MIEIYLTYLIPTLFALISFGYYLIVGKSGENKRTTDIKRYIPIISSSSIILSVFALNFYFVNQLKLEREKFNEILSLKKVNESAFLSNDKRNQLIDSLKSLSTDLSLMLEKIKIEEKIVGENSEIKNDIKSKIKNTKNEIGEIESYNELLNNSILDKNKGYTVQGETSSFIFYCPTDTTSDYLDLKLNFPDKTLVNKIAYLKIEVSNVISETQYISLFRQVYKPQFGVNAFKIKNFFKQKNIALEIGYVLKSEENKVYPYFERYICRR
jgi:hypothetical protein